MKYVYIHQDFTKYLIKNCKGDQLAIVRVIFRWLAAQNIHAIRSTNVNESSVGWRLSRLLEYTGDYAAFFSDMCRWVFFFKRERARSSCNNLLPAIICPTVWCLCHSVLLLLDGTSLRINVHWICLRQSVSASNNAVLCFPRAQFSYCCLLNFCFELCLTKIANFNHYY